MKATLITKVATALAVVVAMGGSGCKATSEAAFKALRACAQNAAQPSDSILYFGPNDVPIGTIYEKVGGGYDLGYRGTSITGEPPLDGLVQKPSYSACSFNGQTKFDLKLAFGISSDALPVSGELSNDFKRATVLKMTADQMGWEMLYKIPYRKRLDENKSISDAIQGRNVYASVSLLKVKGYAVTYQVQAADVPALKAKYPYPSGKVSSDVTDEITAGVDANWESDTTVTLKIDGETAIGGVLRKIKDGKLASGTAESDDGFGDNGGDNKEVVKLNL